MLENLVKMEHLKLQGFPEGSEENVELRIFISNWLASQMQLEEGVALYLLMAIGWGQREEHLTPCLEIF